MEGLATAGRWMVELWRSVAGGMHLADWLDLAIALGTASLAIATFQLAMYSRRSADEAARALAVVTKQADATARHAEVADKALAEQRAQFLRQGRSYIVWDDAESEMSPFVSEDPRTWHEEEASGLSIAMHARLKNVGPTGAYIAKVVYGSRVMLAIVSVPYLAPGQSTSVTIYLAANESEATEFLAEPIDATFASVVTGETGLARGVIGGAGTVHPPDDYGLRKLEGHFYIIPLFEKPEAAS